MYHVLFQTQELQILRERLLDSEDGDDEALFRAMEVAMFSCCFEIVFLFACDVIYCFIYFLLTFPSYFNLKVGFWVLSFFEYKLIHPFKF